MARVSNDAEVLSELKDLLQGEDGGLQGVAVSDPDDITSESVAATAATVQSVAFNVDASAGGIGQTTNVHLIPGNSLLLGVQVLVNTAFNGDTTRDFEVGTGANPDAYIDTVDFAPDGVGNNASNIGGVTNDITAAQWIENATQVVATWTNNASATAGEVNVSLVYITFGYNEGASSINAIRTDLASVRTQLVDLLTSLRNSGHIAPGSDD